MVVPVAAAHIVDDLVAAVVAEIDVKVGHTDPLGVQKPLEQQIVFDRVDVGDAERVGGETARARTAPRSDRDILTFRVADKIVDDQIVFGITHFDYDRQLVFEPLAVFALGVDIGERDAPVGDPPLESRQD